MNELEINCYNFLIELASGLAADFEIQYKTMEEFARWNLPEEIALEWIDAEGMLQILLNSNFHYLEELEILELIIENFNRAFEESLSYVWTYSAMQKDDFWLHQRNLARQLLIMHDSHA